MSDATVYENIAFGIDKSQIDIKKVFESAKRAEIYEYINSLPQKFNTVVGEGGIRLSGGQRQRIGLARSIYRILTKANILILDEATSALDFDTERKVVSSIMNLDKNLTIIMIAHRLNILSNFDRVIELNRGKLIKEGKPKDILNL